VKAGAPGAYPFVYVEFAGSFRFDRDANPNSFFLDSDVLRQLCRLDKMVLMNTPTRTR
jgi:hypothetical protein